MTPYNLPTNRLGRIPSRFRLQATPVATVMLGSMATSLPMIAQVPSLPPFGLIILLTWRLLHAELWPLWIGVPLGAFDDLMSGQPLGTSMFFWSLIMLGIEFMDQRILWRDYWHDWLIVLLALGLFLVGGVAVAHMGGSRVPLVLILPQWVWSVLAYPLVVRIVARVDRWRIMA